MDVTEARAIACAELAGCTDRGGRPLLEHVARVAAAVPPEGAALAWLHDVLEHAASTLEDLLARGLTDLEAEALVLLTRGGDESYDLHTLRIAHAPGPAGALARTVKLADLDDHLASTDPRDMGAPPYSWARSHVAAVHERQRRATAGTPPPRRSAARV